MEKDKKKKSKNVVTARLRTPLSEFSPYESMTFRPGLYFHLEEEPKKEPRRLPREQIKEELIDQLKKGDNEFSVQGVADEYGIEYIKAFEIIKEIRKESTWIVIIL